VVGVHQEIDDSESLITAAANTQNIILGGGGWGRRLSRLIAGGDPNTHARRRQDEQPLQRSTG